MYTCSTQKVILSRGANHGPSIVPRTLTCEYLEFQHGFLHALNVEDHPDELLHGRRELRVGAGARVQLLHLLVILQQPQEICCDVMTTILQFLHVKQSLTLK